MKIARTQLAALVALGTALAMPLAMAQSAVTPEVREAQEAATEAAAQQDATQAPTSADAQPPARQLGWADIDVDGNGTISRSESAALPALAAVFDAADADSDGELTPEEYRAHAAKAGGEG
jgi:hypothetical protein